MLAQIELFKTTPLIVVIVLVAGCASYGPTKPNIPLSESIPVSIAEIENTNKKLAFEILKLPELQDGISLLDNRTIQKIAEVFSMNVQKFDSMFEDMYNIGIPEVRKYCSPLQALYWVAETNDVETIRQVVENYSLTVLLDTAWHYYGNSSVPEYQIDLILSGVRNRKLRADLSGRRKRVSNQVFKSVLVDAYQRKKSAFSKDAATIIELMVDPRWSSFSIVAERLNSPELVDYYVKKRIRYVPSWSLPNSPMPPSWVFKYNKGACISISRFIIYCLKKGGYWAMEIHLPSPDAAFHTACQFKMHGKKYVMDNGRPLPAGYYPYDSIRK